MYDKIIFWRPFLKQHYQLAASGLKDISIFKKLSQSDRRDSSFIGSVNSLCAFREQVVRLVGRSVGRSVGHHFLKGREVTLTCSNRSSCLTLSLFSHWCQKLVVLNLIDRHDTILSKIFSKSKSIRIYKHFKRTIPLFPSKVTNRYHLIYKYI